LSYYYDLLYLEVLYNLKKGIIIQASARSNGNTSKIVNAIKSQTQFDVVDLNQKKINHFDYEFKNKNDDFNLLFKEIAKSYDVVLFATPIYWYTMSGVLKVFLDRISDFLFHEKEFGRLLRGKQMGIVSCGSDTEIFEGFEMPFVQSANYLGMDYLGHLHTWIVNEHVEENVKNLISEYVTNKIN